MQRPAAPAPAPAPWHLPGLRLKPEACVAADKYIAEREDKRLLGIDVPRHARYAGATGALIYAGTRHVDGQALALLKHGDLVLVLPIDGVTAQRVRRIPVGDSVAVSPKGGISTGKGRGLR
jgi:hypothetical protein